jgi:hypothetical protein
MRRTSAQNAASRRELDAIIQATWSNPFGGAALGELSRTMAQLGQHNLTEQERS